MQAPSFVSVSAASRWAKFPTSLVSPLPGLGADLPCYSHAKTAQPAQAASRRFWRRDREDVRANESSGTSVALDLGPARHSAGRSGGEHKWRPSYSTVGPRGRRGPRLPGSPGACGRATRPWCCGAPWSARRCPAMPASCWSASSSRLHMLGNLKIFLGAEAINTYAVFLRTMGEPMFPYRWASVIRPSSLPASPCTSPPPSSSPG